MVQPKRPYQIGWKRGDTLESLLTREWLVTNALGGYASGTIGGACTRRFHGKLIAALPAPLGRMMMLNHLEEWITDSEGRTLRLSGDEHGLEIRFPDAGFLEEFALERGLPVWRFRNDTAAIEKRVLMPHLQNTTYIAYRLMEGSDEVTLHLRPSLNFRAHEGLLSHAAFDGWHVGTVDHGVEISDGREDLALRLLLFGRDAQLVHDPRVMEHVVYRLERSRGYEHEGPLWSPGIIHIRLQPAATAGVVASVESWDIVRALTVREAFAAEDFRRRRLLGISLDTARDDISAQLVLAADQFLIEPRTRAAEEARVRARGEDPRTVIAGYHWFTDWGRDTMISLEGLTLTTGRHREAASILRTFASYIRDGLIPNLFPEGDSDGLYHTADATMWFFHAVLRYLRHTNDHHMLVTLLPRLVEIVDHHVRGTHFNIHVDAADGLLVQGAAGYQLTWMDAKVDGWVVTPRRGKAVEINALFYNALRILEGFLVAEKDDSTADRIRELATRVQKSFNERFWFEDGKYLYDIVDAEGGGNDSALRPNQIFSISLDHPVLDRSRWEAVTEKVREALLTPAGLRSLSRDHPDYKPVYDGDLRSRDAAYHQGTVWGWLIGPFIDAWVKVHPNDIEGARSFLSGFIPHLGDACIGSISEVFDAESPYTPRGCAAQAWSVAEVLRCVTLLNGRNDAE